MKKLLAAAVLFASSAFSQEVPVSEPVIGPAIGTRTRPSIASNGSEFLATWTSSIGTRGVRVNALGEVLDPTGIHLGPRALETAVASDGESWLVAAPSRDGTAIVRVDRDGSARVVTTLEGRDDAALSWNGSTYLLATIEYLGFSSPLHVRELAHDGMPLGGWKTIATHAYAPALAWNNGRYLAGLVDPAGVEHVMPLERDGTLAGAPAVIARDVGRFDPAIAPAGEGFYVAYTDSATGNIRFRYVSRDGALAQGERTLADDGGNSEPSLAISFTTGWVATWKHGKELRVASFNPFTVLPAATVAVAQGDLLNGAVATSSGFGYATWGDLVAGARDLDILGISLNRPALTRLSTAAAHQTFPTFAAGRAAWLEPAGERRQTNVFVTPGVRVHASNERQFAPRITATRVYWIEGVRLYTKRLDALDTAPQDLGFASSYGVLTIGSDDVLVITDNTVRFARILANGSVVGPTPTSALVTEPRLARGDDGNLLVAGNLPVCTAIVGHECLPTPTAMAHLLDASGNLLVSRTLSPRYTAGVTPLWNGREYVVLWVENTSLYASRLSRSGELLDAAPIRLIERLSDVSEFAAAVRGGEIHVAAGGSTTLRLLRFTPELRLTSDLSYEAPVGARHPVINDGVVAYERIRLEAPFGGASRVMLRPLPELQPRRRATGR